MSSKTRIREKFQIDHAVRIRVYIIGCKKIYFNLKNVLQFQNYTVRDMFIKHLIQLHGMSVEKANSITKKYPTPQSLRNAFMLHPSPESMLSEMSYGLGSRSIGPVLSKAVYELYMNRHLS